MENTESTLALLANLTVETAKQTALLERLTAAIEAANTQPERPKTRRKYQTQDPKERVKRWIVGKIATSGNHPSSRGELASLMSSGDRHLLNDAIDELVSEGSLLLVPSPRKVKRYTVPERAAQFPILDSQGIGWKIVEFLKGSDPLQAPAIKACINFKGSDEEFDSALGTCIDRGLVSIQKSEPEAGLYWHGNWYGVTDLGRKVF